MTLYLSRLTIARRPAANAIRELIDPAPSPTAGRLGDPGKGRMMDAHHRLLWAVYGDDPDRRRDFLWRAEGKGRFLTLSHRPPAQDGAGLFDPPEVKTFAPDLREGDRLAFVLRANATRTRKNPADPTRRGERVDVVMDAIYALPPGAVSDQRREMRMAAAQTAGRAWLERRGEKAGFVVEAAEVGDYSVVPLPEAPRRGKKPPQFGVLEFSGALRIADPQVFLAAVGEGFGRARAFGCGLMLIRRA